MKVTRIRRGRVMFAPGTDFRAACRFCGREVATPTAGERLRLRELENRTLENLVAVGKFHVAETAGGSLRFCKDSLFSN